MGTDEITARWLLVSLVIVNVLFTVITALKGKPWLALLSLSATVVGVIGAVRLAKPGSPWARYRYKDRPDLLARAERRAERWEARKHRYITLLAGAHDQPRRPAKPVSPRVPPAMRPALRRVTTMRRVSTLRDVPTRRVRRGSRR
jgi:hypothetical protein